MSVIKPNHHPNRESWLNGVAGRLRPAFAQLGAPLPDRLRIAIGFPSGGQRAKATGECWDSTASADGTFEILIRPVNAARILALPQTPCCQACTVRANQGDTWTHIRGVFFRVLDLAILRSAITQSDAGGPNTRARHHRGSATLNVGGMPSVLLLVAARS